MQYPCRNEGRARVLFLSGWSDGPLDALRERFADRCEFIDVRLHMPPSGVLWLLTWEAVLICAYGLVFLWAWLRLGVMLQMVALVPAALGCWPLITLLVRGCIRRCVASAAKAIERHDADIVVGFSWGGGIACWLLRSHEFMLGHSTRWRGHSTLLLAPTLHVAAAVARLPLPVPFFEVRDGDDHGRVHIFHAVEDGWTSAAQQRALAQTGAQMHAVLDTHVLQDPTTRTQISRVFAHLLEHEGF
jgi:hypothetical protein